jgi:hypothetical protein
MFSTKRIRNTANAARVISAIIILLLLPERGISQPVIKERNTALYSTIVANNGVNVETIERSESDYDYLLPAIETVGNNVFVFYLNKYVLGNPDWTKISFRSVKYNIQHGFVWDHDGFEMNALFHPYSGALSFTSARSNGLPFWHSIIYPFAGSLMWELAMETELPSSNDLISTTSSGIVLGEISFRISSLILNDNTVGMERLWRELAAGVLSPVHGINRLLNGQSWRIGPVPRHSDYLVSLSVGTLGLFVDREIYKKHPHGFLNFHMDYGTPYIINKNYQPFDYFTANFGLGISTNNTIIDITGSGMLWGKKLTLSDYSKTSFGIFKNFDFLNTAIYRVGSSSIGVGLYSKIDLSETYVFESAIKPSMIVMGAINSEYAQPLGRDYNLGPGLDGKINASISHKSFGKVYFNYDRSWIYVVSGAKGDEVVGIWQTGLQLQISRTVLWAFEYLEYSHIGTYEIYASLHKNNFAVRTYLVTTI